jgi:Major Facilitator Superfamily
VRSRCCPRACSATARPTSAQVVRGYDAIQTGVISTAETLGLLASSLAAERLAKRRPQRTLILAGFAVTIGGIGVLLAMVKGTPNVWAFAPGLLLIGLGLGLILTPSVNVVQSSFDEEPQGRFRACRAACPTSGPPSAWRSPARPRGRHHCHTRALVRARDGRLGGGRCHRPGGRGPPARRPAHVGASSARRVGGAGLLTWTPLAALDQNAAVITGSSQLAGSRSKKGTVSDRAACLLRGPIALALITGHRPCARRSRRELDHSHIAKLVILAG